MFFAKNIFFLIVFLIGGILLQILLSKKESKLLGLILPGITFLYSILAILNIVSFGSLKETIVLILTTFIITNIPTAILLAIYFSIRKSSNINEIDKINIQDLN